MQASVKEQFHQNRAPLLVQFLLKERGVASGEAVCPLQLSSTGPGVHWWDGPVPLLTF